MSNPLAEHPLQYWLVISGLSLLAWVLGYIDKGNQKSVTMPRWVLLLLGIKNQPKVGIRRLYEQLFGLLMFAWGTLVTIFVPFPEQRTLLVTLGMVTLGIGLGVITIALMILKP